MSNATSPKVSISVYTRRLVSASLFVALSMVLKLTLEVYIAESLRFNLCNVPIILSGVFLGPVWGFCVACLSDIVNFIVNNQTGNAFNPAITLATGFIGLVPGLVYARTLPGRDAKEKKGKGGLPSLGWSVLNIGLFIILLVFSGGLLIATKIATVQNGILLVSGEPVSTAGIVAAAGIIVAYAVLLIWFIKAKSSRTGAFSGDKMLFAVAAEEVLVSGILMPVILYYMFGAGFLATMPIRFLKILVMVPLTTVLTLVLANTISRYRLIK